MEQAPCQEPNISVEMGIELLARWSYTARQKSCLGRCTVINATALGYPRELRAKSTHRLKLCYQWPLNTSVWEQTPAKGSGQQMAPGSWLCFGGGVRKEFDHA